ncbi:MAG TPA: chorismate mutase [Fluviicola sp.]|nr:chorismate mutase [Fluviicola sp.]
MSNLIQRSGKRPFLIAGPCSAETEEQVMETVQQLQKHCSIDLLRAGIWKPRTRPDSFEGIGEVGLEWLVTAGKAIGVPTTTEVANARHAELALKAGVDVLWIGARTTVNPFAVQEIADVLEGTKIPVLVKNPVNPDLELWIGAFERLEKAGITDLAAIHRGFSVYKHPKYRNVPSWELPLALRDRLPHIPLICDPSHISGKRSLLLEVSQKAMDLNFDGLMIESHRNPDEAWSDAAQQLTPANLDLLIKALVLRSREVSDNALGELEELREKISVLDDRLFEILTARMRLSEDVGAFKREHNITILQEEHWRKMIAGRLEKAGEYGLAERFVSLVMNALHQESIRHQTRIMNPNVHRGEHD